MRHRTLLLAACGVLSATALPGLAADQYWDVNGSDPGLGGTGVWSTAATNWNDATGTGAPAVWSNGNSAIFDGTAGTVTVSGTVQVDTMTFNTTGYQIAGTALTLVGAGTFHVGGGLTVTATNALSSVVGVTKTGSGTLILDTNSNYSVSGGLHIKDGTVIIDRDDNTGFSGNQVINIGDGVGAAGSAVLRLTGTGSSHMSNASPVNINSDGVFDAGDVTKTVGTTTIAKGGTIQIGSGHLTIGTTTFVGGGSSSSAGGVLSTGNVTYQVEPGGVTAMISGGALHNGTVRSYSINDDPDLDIEVIISAELRGTAGEGFSRSGAGTLLINGNSPNFEGTIRASSGGGVLLVGPAEYALGNSNATIGLVNGIIGSSDGGDRVVYGLISMSGGNGFTVTGAGDFHFVNTNTSFHNGGSNKSINVVSADTTVTIDSGIAPADISQDFGITKNGLGTLVLNGNNTYIGPTTVNAGTLILNGVTSGTSGVTVASGATLGGSGTIASTISGGGLISPGNSPGILTANAVNPAGGLDFAFAFAKPGSPNYNNATASVNDVLRLTGASPFSGNTMNAGNVVSVYLPAHFNDGSVFRGGFYTDAGDFLASVSGANYVYYIQVGGGSVVFDGVGYELLTDIRPNAMIQLSMVNEAGTQFGSIDGWVTQFTITGVPEPATAMLTGLGVLLIGTRRKRRR